MGNILLTFFLKNKNYFNFWINKNSPIAIAQWIIAGSIMYASIMPNFGAVGYVDNEDAPIKTPNNAKIYIKGASANVQIPNIVYREIR